MMVKLYYDKITPYFDQKYFDECYEKVGVYRQKKIDAYKDMNSKARSLAAGMLLIKGTQDMGIELLLDSIVIGEHGKPDFKEGTGWHFSLSHSGEYVMLGISDGIIGVDIQEQKDLKGDLAKRFFHQEEQEYLSKLSKGDYSEAFFRIWCLKESFVKYTGNGMSEGLETFSVLHKLDRSELVDDRYVSAYWAD